MAIFKSSYPGMSGSVKQNKHFILVMKANKLLMRKKITEDGNGYF